MNLIILLFIPFHLFLSNDPKESEKSLFLIERNRDANRILYDIRLTDDGLPDPEKPIEVYWLKQAEDGRKEPLSWVQQKFAYGIRFLSIHRDEVRFQFVSYKERDFFLRKAHDGIFKVYTSSLGQPIQVDRIFVQIDGGTFWFPRISRVELHGKSVLTGRPTLEIIRPQQS